MQNGGNTSQSNRFSARLLAGILVVFVAIVVLTPAALCWIFFLGKVYAFVVFATNVVLMGIVLWFFRKHSKVVRRIENALGAGEPSNDPRQMARWVR
ncbi:MAG TPA: hypothetical protein VMU05_02165 [Dongiaceae bacterium]|nr:hypothetical protein [Dongiaceae bacterium]